MCIDVAPPPAPATSHTAPSEQLANAENELPSPLFPEQFLTERHRAMHPGRESDLLPPPQITTWRFCCLENRIPKPIKYIARDGSVCYKLKAGKYYLAQPVHASSAGGGVVIMRGHTYAIAFPCLFSDSPLRKFGGCTIAYEVDVRGVGMWRLTRMLDFENMRWPTLEAAHAALVPRIIIDPETTHAVSSTTPFIVRADSIDYPPMDANCHTAVVPGRCWCEMHALRGLLHFELDLYHMSRRYKQRMGDFTGGPMALAISGMVEVVNDMIDATKDYYATCKRNGELEPRYTVQTANDNTARQERRPTAENNDDDDDSNWDVTDVDDQAESVHDNERDTGANIDQAVEETSDWETASRNFADNTISAPENAAGDQSGHSDLPEDSDDLVAVAEPVGQSSVIPATQVMSAVDTAPLLGQRVTDASDPVQSTPATFNASSWHSYSLRKSRRRSHLSRQRNARANKRFSKLTETTNNSLWQQGLSLRLALIQAALSESEGEWTSEEITSAAQLRNQYHRLARKFLRGLEKSFSDANLYSCGSRRFALGSCLAQGKAAEPLLLRKPASKLLGWWALRLAREVVEKFKQRTADQPEVD